MMISTHHLAVLAGFASMPLTFIATAATVFDPDPSAEYCYNEDDFPYDYGAFDAAPGYEGCAPICGELDSLAFFTEDFYCECVFALGYFGLSPGDILEPGEGKCPSNSEVCVSGGNYDGRVCYRAMKPPTGSPSVASSDSPSKPPSSSPSVASSDSPSLLPSGSPSVASSDSPSKPLSGSPSVATSDSPSLLPSGSPSVASSDSPSKPLSGSPSVATSDSPSLLPTGSPSVASSDSPSKPPSRSPSVASNDSSSLLPSGSPSVASDPVVDSCVTHSECKRKGLGKEECKGHHGKNKKCRMRKEDCKMFGTKHHGRWSCKQGKKCATMDTDTGEKWGKCIKR